MRVLLIGDSIADGLTSPLRSLVPVLVASTHIGSMTSYWTGRVSSLVASNRPDVLVVALGTNDAYNNRPTSEIAANARAIVNAAGGVLVVWVGPTIGPLTVEAIRSVVPRFLDVRSLNLSLSGVHPNGAGYQRIAQAVLPLLGSAQGSNFNLNLPTGDNTKAKLILAVIVILLLTR